MIGILNTINTLRKGEAPTPPPPPEPITINSFNVDLWFNNTAVYQDTEFRVGVYGNKTNTYTIA